MAAPAVPAADAGASSISKGLAVWGIEFASAVLMILCNKALMSGDLAFRFPVTLTAAHFAWTAAGSGLVQACKQGSEEQPQLPPWWAVGAFVVLSSAAIILSNASLLLNSVAFYQIMKLATLPFVAAVEWLARTKSFTWRHLLFFAVILLGVGLTIVGDVTASLAGVLVACVSFMSAGLHQFYCARLQSSFGLSPSKLLAMVSPFKAGLLFCIGPVLDKVLFGSWIVDYGNWGDAVGLVLLTCVLAISLNMAQYACINLLGASLYSALSQGKTAAVVVLGSLYFLGRVDLRQLAGTTVAIVGVFSLTAYERSLRAAAAEAAAEQLPVTAKDTQLVAAQTGTSDEAGSGPRSETERLLGGPAHSVK